VSSTKATQASWTSAQKSCSKASSATEAPLAKKNLVPKKLYIEKQKTAEKEIFYEGASSVSSFMQDLVRYLELSLLEGEWTYLVSEVTHS
jgi:hypothetical protein